MSQVIDNINKNQWFTEIVPHSGTAFSFKINKKLDEMQSEFQKVEIFETEHFGNLMTIDGFVMLTTRDNFLYHEMMSHPALFTHPNPENVVIIGGGDCGTLQQVLRHEAVKSAIQIDIDEAVTILARKYFPELCENNIDPRAELAFLDGIQWMREAPDDSIDIIIVDSTEATDEGGPAEGLFNLEFYQNCRRALKDDGILIQQSESPLINLENVIRPMHKNMQQVGFDNTKTLFFPQPCYPTGWWSATMASNLDLNNFREEDAQNKEFETKYYNSAIHKGALASPEFF